MGPQEVNIRDSCRVCLLPLCSLLIAAAAWNATGFEATRMDNSDKLDPKCDIPTASAVWRMDPIGYNGYPGSGDPKHPSRGLALGILVQRIDVSYELCSCLVFDDPNLGKFVTLEGCSSTHHSHFEMRVLRELGSTRTDRLHLSGEPEAHEALTVAESKFVPASAPGVLAIMNDPVWDKSGTGKVAANGSLPYGHDHVVVGQSVSSHDAPAGSDTDFGGVAEVGGDHSLSMVWICCEEIKSAQAVASP